jgi:hypothetical protein
LDTNLNGDISGIITIPAVASGSYELKAEQQNYNIEVNETFRVGTIIVILAPKTGPSGTKVTLTGTGFTSGGKWDAYFGEILIFNNEDISGDTTLFGSIIWFILCPYCRCWRAFSHCS